MEELVLRLQKLHSIRVHYGRVLNSGTLGALNVCYRLLKLNGVNEAGLNFIGDLIGDAEKKLHTKLIKQQKEDGTSHTDQV